MVWRVCFVQSSRMIRGEVGSVNEHLMLNAVYTFLLYQA